MTPDAVAADTATEATTTEAAVTETVETDTDTTDYKAEAEKWKNQARKHEERAKANASAARELEQFRTAAMSDQEKAVEAARAEGRTEALRESGTKVVDAEVRAAAAGRSVDIEALLEGLDRAKFLGDDGEADRDAITAWVDRVAPKPEPTEAGFPDLGQGVRGQAQALNGDPLLRDLKSKVGVR